MSKSSKIAPGGAVWVAQGFGVGRIPKAPGTWGSVVGIGWTTLLLAFNSVPAYLAGSIVGVALSVWLCGAAERVLKEHDPSSVVLDEIVALPFCFLPWVLWQANSAGPPPAPWELFTHWHGGLCLSGFGLFRLFDIWKPWPVRQTQRLPGGWGVCMDDLLAAAYVALGLLILLVLVK